MRIATLTAINEAIRALDFEAPEPLETDSDLDLARDLLLEARAKLTSKPWPELGRPQERPVLYLAWVQIKSAEQRDDGRQ